MELFNIIKILYSLKIKNLNFKIITRELHLGFYIYRQGAVELLKDWDSATYSYFAKTLHSGRKRRESFLTKAFFILMLVLGLFQGAAGQALAQKFGSVISEVNIFNDNKVDSLATDFGSQHFEDYDYEDKAIDTLQDSSVSSPNFRPPFRIKPLSKRDYRGEEPTTVVIESGNVSDLKFKLTDIKGKEVKADIEVISDGDPVVVKVHPPHEFRPGRYKISVTDSAGAVSSRDFTWGVLAINPNRSIYTVGQQAFLSMAVLNDTGDMVCNADVTLKITDPGGTIHTFTTQSGTIIVNPECFKKELTSIPDFQAIFDVGGVGVYDMELTAKTDNGTRTINDGFEVRSEVPFDVERSGPTRIYPPETYPITLTILANQDFTGTITEVVPKSFKISSLEGALPFDSIELKNEEDANKSVLGASIFNVSLPYVGNFPTTLGFGRQHKDTTLSAKYTSFGVLGHDGADFGVPAGTRIVATDTGEVVMASTGGPYGYTVVIQHSWGKSYYGHLSKFAVEPGQKVLKGQEIALSGSTGLSSGPHLHFSIKPEKNDMGNGYYGKIDPLPFLGLKDPGINSGQVAGVTTASGEETSEGVQVIKWQVSVKKGETIKVGYKFDAPQISPELYLLGPLEMKETSGKSAFSEARQWQIAADSIVVQGTPAQYNKTVVVNGGIVDTETQFGGLQRKVVYMPTPAAWYAFYNDGGDVFFKKCLASSGCDADGDWSAAVDVNDDAGNDDYNPSIAVSGDIIHVCWIDDGGNQVECDRINTASSDAEDATICTIDAEAGGLTNTVMVSIAAFSTTSTLVMYSDTGAGTVENAFELTSIGSTCAGNLTANTVITGDIIFGSGVGDGDRPVLVGMDSTRAGVVFQDGDLSFSMYDASRNEWRRNNQTIAAVTHNIYSVTTDGTNIWVLATDTTQNDDALLYSVPVANTGIVESTALDSDVGASGDEQDTEMDISCPTAANCKIVYIDDLDTASPDLVFVDCNDAACSVPTLSIIDSDVGSATIASSPTIYCVASDNCKIVYGDMLGGNSPDIVFVDCGDETCSGTSGTCTSGTRSCSVIDSDLGGSTSKPNVAIYCLGDTDCQVTYFEDVTDDLWIADCSAADCSTRDTLAAIKLNINTTNNNARSSIWCPTSGDCKILYHDAVNGDLVFFDCAATTCASGTTTVIDADVGTTAVNVPNSVDCTGGATECRLLYSDGSQLETNFVDCAASAACASATTTKLDDSSGGLVTFGVDLDCSNGIGDCKGVFVGNTTGGAEDQYFFDCDNDTCTSGSVVDLDNPPTRAALDCPASDDCKLTYIEVNATVPQLMFADCTNENCLPEWADEADPFTAQTNLLSASITYDSTNSDLYATAIHDASEKAYIKSSDATTISWGSATDLGFTAGTLNHISTPQSGTSSGIGAVISQGSNFEASLFVAGVGIIETEVQFGGLQRKVAYVNGNWYAFYNDGTDVWYKKSAGGTTWGSAVDVDTSDADNLNPSIWVEGNLIYVAWIDDSGDQVEVNTINTASSDALGTKCSMTSLGAVGSTQMVTVAVADDGTVYAAQSDINGGTIYGVQKLVFAGCTTTDITTGSGLTAGDRPVIITQGNFPVMIFQTGSALLLSAWTTRNGVSAWPITSRTIASISDNLYSVATDQNGKIWVLTVNSGGTAVSAYSLPTPVYSIVGENTSNTTYPGNDIFCPTVNNCKMVYEDAVLDDIIFVDCNDENCSNPTKTTIDSAVGTSNSGIGLYCPTSDTCKIAFSDNVTFVVHFAYCNNSETCAGTTCDTPTNCTQSIISIGSNEADVSMDCPAGDGSNCKVFASNNTAGTVLFADCNDSSCSAPGTPTTIATTGGGGQEVAIKCPTSDNCKLVYSSRGGSGNVVFFDCNNEACSLSAGNTTLDADIGTTSRVGVGVDCPTSTTCKVAFSDATDGDTVFAYCNNSEFCSGTTCTSGSEVNCRDLDITSGGPQGVDIACPAGDGSDCKVFYNDTIATDATFIDCNDSSCSSPTVNIIDAVVASGRSRYHLYCLTASTCKLIYNDSDTNGDHKYVSCVDGGCGTIVDEADPWTGQTNVTSASITYDSTNGRLYAATLKNTSEVAYWKTSPISAIAWSGERDIGFLAGDLGHISTPMSVVSSATLNANRQIGAVVRQGTNFEFSQFGFPLLDDLMRHGKWIINGIEQPFTF